MQLLAVADDDSLLCQIPPVTDCVLLSLGDLHDDAIRRAIGHHRPRRCFAVKGNHDGAGAFSSEITDLHLRIEDIDGVRFGGLAGSWRYKPRGHHLFEQAEVSLWLREFPRVDVFIAHNSPAGVHERDRDVHQGFQGLLEYVHRTKPRMLIHGHQHANQITLLGETVVVGVFGEQLIDFR